MYQEEVSSTTGSRQYMLLPSSTHSHHSHQSSVRSTGNISSLEHNNPHSHPLLPPSQPPPNNSNMYTLEHNFDSNLTSRRIVTESCVEYFNTTSQSQSHMTTSRIVTPIVTTESSVKNKNIAPTPTLGGMPTKGSTKKKVNRGRWTRQEDDKLRHVVELHGEVWSQVSAHFSDRNDVQCQQRWNKVISPKLVKGPWTPDVCDNFFEIFTFFCSFFIFLSFFLFFFFLLVENYRKIKKFLNLWMFMVHESGQQSHVI